MQVIYRNTRKPWLGSKASFRRFRTFFFGALLAVIPLILSSVSLYGQSPDQRAVLQETEAKIEAARTPREFWETFEKYRQLWGSQLSSYPGLIKQIAEDIQQLRKNSGSDMPKDSFRAYAEFFHEFSRYQSCLSGAPTAPDKANKLPCLVSIANLCQKNEYFSQALEFYRQALKECKNRGDSQIEPVILNNMGATYFALKASPDASKCLNEALEKARITGNNGLEGVVLNNLAEMQASRDELEKALEAHKSALTMCKKRKDGKGEWLHTCGIENVVDKLCEKYSDNSKYCDEKYSRQRNSRGLWLPAYFEDDGYSVIIFDDSVYSSTKALLEQWKKLRSAAEELQGGVRR